MGWAAAASAVLGTAGAIIADSEKAKKEAAAKREMFLRQARATKSSRLLEDRNKFMDYDYGGVNYDSMNFQAGGYVNRLDTKGIPKILNNMINSRFIQGDVVHNRKKGRLGMLKALTKETFDKKTYNKRVPAPQVYLAMKASNGVYGVQYKDLLQRELRRSRTNKNKTDADSTNVNFANGGFVDAGKNSMLAVNDRGTTQGSHETGHNISFENTQGREVKLEPGEVLIDGNYALSKRNPTPDNSFADQYLKLKGESAELTAASKRMPDKVQGNLLLRRAGVLEGKAADIKVQQEQFNATNEQEGYAGVETNEMQAGGSINNYEWIPGAKGTYNENDLFMQRDNFQRDVTPTSPTTVIRGKGNAPVYQRRPSGEINYTSNGKLATRTIDYTQQAIPRLGDPVDRDMRFSAPLDANINYMEQYAKQLYDEELTKILKVGAAKGHGDNARDKSNAYRAYLPKTVIPSRTKAKSTIPSTDKGNSKVKTEDRPPSGMSRASAPNKGFTIPQRTTHSSPILRDTYEDKSFSDLMGKPPYGSTKKSTSIPLSNKFKSTSGTASPTTETTGATNGGYKASNSGNSGNASMYIDNIANLGLLAYDATKPFSQFPGAPQIANPSFRQYNPYGEQGRISEDVAKAVKDIDLSTSNSQVARAAKAQLLTAGLRAKGEAYSKATDRNVANYNQYQGTLADINKTNALTAYDRDKSAYMERTRKYEERLNAASANIANLGDDVMTQENNKQQMKLAEQETNMLIASNPEHGVRMLAAKYPGNREGYIKDLVSKGYTEKWAKQQADKYIK